MNSPQDVALIATEVLSVMLHMDLTVCDQRPDAGYPISGSVEIHGTWQGIVQVDATPGFAMEAAHRMFKIPIDQVTTVDQDDALAELTNIVGGNVKGMLPGPASLSLPSVARNSSMETGADTAPVLQVALAWENESLQIQLIAS